MNLNPSLIQVRNLCFSYGAEAVLEGVNFEVRQGDFLGIIGPNGAGKSTLIKILLGLLRPRSGSVVIGGETPERARSRIGYVPQSLKFDPEFPITVIEAVMMGTLSRGRWFGRWRKADRMRAGEVIEKVGLTGLGSRRLSDLSGGQRQRVLLARAIAGDSKILILDEPVTSVDLPMGMRFYEFLDEWRKTMTILLVTHDIGVVPQRVDRLLCLNRTVFHYETKEEALKHLDELYGCPVDVIAHGIPHRVLDHHEHGASDGRSNPGGAA